MVFFKGKSTYTREKDDFDIKIVSFRLLILEIFFSL